MAVKPLVGKDVQLSIGGDAVGCATQISIQVQAGTVDVTCAASGDWAETKPGQKSWSGSLSGVQRITTAGEIATNVTATELFNMLVNGTLVSVVFDTAAGTPGDFIYTGSGYITNLQLEAAPTGDGEATFSADITGTGALVQTLATNTNNQQPSG